MLNKCFINSIPKLSGSEINWSKNLDFLSLLTKQSTSVPSDEVSRAKEGQILLVTKLPKNILNTIIVYLKSNEIFSLLKSSRVINQKLAQDLVFKKTCVDALFRFFFQQFTESQNILERSMHSLASY